MGAGPDTGPAAPAAADDLPAAPTGETVATGAGRGPGMGPARKAALGVGAVLVALLALFVWGVTSGGGGTDALAASPLDGELAPEIDGDTLDGGTYRLSSERGRWVVVNFFATWCPPCVKEHPELIEFDQRHAAVGDRRLVSVVFGGPEEAEAAREFFARNGGDWPVVIDPTGSLAVDYAVAKVPESILVSPTGLVYRKVRGGVTADGLDALIDAVEAEAARS